MVFRRHGKTIALAVSVLVEDLRTVVVELVNTTTTHSLICSLGA